MFSSENCSHLFEKESSSLSEGHEVMLKAEGMLRENMGSSIWSRGSVVARSFLSARVGAMPGGRVRDGERVRLSGLVSTIFSRSLSVTFTETHWLSSPLDSVIWNGHIIKVS